MKRYLAAILALAALCACLSGCAGKKKSAFELDNEILTYERVDADKTVITASVSGNIPINNLIGLFEEKNPDVQVLTIDITGGTETYRPMVQWLENGDTPDVVFSQSRFLSDENTVEYFENLSANPVIDNYTAGSLNRVSIDGNIYMLPGPSTLYCLHYNEDMFDKYAWKIPGTLDEFVELCQRIREDTKGAVQPFNPNAKYSTELIALLEALCYDQLFAGLDNRGWYQGVIAGTERFEGHMEPFFEAVKTLAERGVLLPEHFSYSATTRGKEFWAGDIAMANFSVSVNDAPEFKAGYAPFPSTTGTGYIIDIMDVLIGVTKKERDDKHKDAVNRLIMFLSTPDAQECLANGRVMFSSIIDSPTLGVGDISQLDQTIASGHMFSRLDFEGSAITRDDIQDYVKRLVMGEISVGDCISGLDARIAGGAPQITQSPVVAKAEEDFTILEVSNYMADMYRGQTGADIGLIAVNNVYRGNVMRIYKGDITTEMVKVLLPRSFGNDSALIKAEMTGRQIIDALNSPLGNSETADCVYAFSGLKCVVNPWKPLGERYLSVKLENGAELDMDKVYTVAFWEGTVKDEFVTGAVERFEGSFTELLTAKLESDKAIKPAKDGRITLKWN